MGQDFPPKQQHLVLVFRHLLTVAKRRKGCYKVVNIAKGRAGAWRGRMGFQEIHVFLIS